MVLLPQQIIQRLKQPATTRAITQAIEHENRIRFHSEVTNDEGSVSPYLSKFKEWVKNGVKLPEDKYAAFEGMLRYPIPTTAICNTIFDEYEKIFTAEDAYFNPEIDDTLKEDCLTYLKSLRIRDYFKNEGFDTYKTRPAAIYVVDLPAIQTTPRPEPFFERIPIQWAIELVMEKARDNTERIGFLAYSADRVRYVVIDDAAYYVFVKQESGDFLQTVYAPHTLGYCPATFIPNTRLNGFDSPIARKVTLSSSVQNLDYLLMFTIFQRCFEQYATWPVMTAPETDCQYEDERGNRCVEGFVTAIRDDGTRYQKRCPACRDRGSLFVGPGTVFRQAAPTSSEDAPIGEAVFFTGPETETLKWVADRIDALEWKIYEDNVGDNNEMLTKEAVNEKQVVNSTEGKKNLFLKVAKDFESTEKFIIDTICALRYPGFYRGCELSYGEAFILYDINELQEKYSNSKKAGLPNFITAQILDQYIQTEYKNNSYMRQRSRLLVLLEPWPMLSISDCQLVQYNVLFPEKFTLKINFSNYIRIFELEYGDIVAFNPGMDPLARIQLIFKTLLSYGQQEYGPAKQIGDALALGSSSGTAKS